MNQLRIILLSSILLAAAVVFGVGLWRGYKSSDIPEIQKTKITEKPDKRPDGQKASNLQFRIYNQKTGRLTCNLKAAQGILSDITKEEGEFQGLELEFFSYEKDDKAGRRKTLVKSGSAVKTGKRVELKDGVDIEQDGGEAIHIPDALCELGDGDKETIILSEGEVVFRQRDDAGRDLIEIRGKGLLARTQEKEFTISRDVSMEMRDAKKLGDDGKPLKVADASCSGKAEFHFHKGLIYFHDNVSLRQPGMFLTCGDLECRLSPDEKNREVVFIQALPADGKRLEICLQAGNSEPEASDAARVYCTDKLEMDLVKGDLIINGETVMERADMVMECGKITGKIDSCATQENPLRSLTALGRPETGVSVNFSPKDGNTGDQLTVHCVESVIFDLVKDELHFEKQVELARKDLSIKCDSLICSFMEGAGKKKTLKDLSAKSAGSIVSMEMMALDEEGKQQSINAKCFGMAVLRMDKDELELQKSVDLKREDLSLQCDRLLCKFIPDDKGGKTLGELASWARGSNKDETLKLKLTRPVEQGGPLDVECGGECVINLQTGKLKVEKVVHLKRDRLELDCDLLTGTLDPKDPDGEIRDLVASGSHEQLKLFRKSDKEGIPDLVAYCDEVEILHEKEMKDYRLGKSQLFKQVATLKSLPGKSGKKPKLTRSEDSIQAKVISFAQEDQRMWAEGDVEFHIVPRSKREEVDPKTGKKTVMIRNDIPWDGNAGEFALHYQELPKDANVSGFAELEEVRHLYAGGHLELYSKDTASGKILRRLKGKEFRWDSESSEGLLEGGENLPAQILVSSPEKITRDDFSDKKDLPAQDKRKIVFDSRSDLVANEILLHGKEGRYEARTLKSLTMMRNIQTFDKNGLLKRKTEDWVVFGQTVEGFFDGEKIQGQGKSLFEATLGLDLLDRVIMTGPAEKGKALPARIVVTSMLVENLPNGAKRETPGNHMVEALKLSADLKANSILAEEKPVLRFEMEGQWDLGQVMMEKGPQKEWIVDGTKLRVDLTDENDDLTYIEMEGPVFIRNGELNIWGQDFKWNAAKRKGILYPKFKEGSKTEAEQRVYIKTNKGAYLVDYLQLRRDEDGKNYLSVGPLEQDLDGSKNNWLK